MKNLGKIPMTEKVHDELTLASLFGGLAINSAGSGVVHAMGYPSLLNLNFPRQSQRSAHALGIQVQRRGQT